MPEPTVVPIKSDWPHCGLCNEAIDQDTERFVWVSDVPTHYSCLAERVYKKELDALDPDLVRLALRSRRTRQGSGSDSMDWY